MLFQLFSIFASLTDHYTLCSRGMRDFSIFFLSVSKTCHATSVKSGESVRASKTHAHAWQWYLITKVNFRERAEFHETLVLTATTLACPLTPLLLFSCSWPPRKSCYGDCGLVSTCGRSEPRWLLETCDAGETTSLWRRVHTCGHPTQCEGRS